MSNNDGPVDDDTNLPLSSSSSSSSSAIASEHQPPATPRLAQSALSSFTSHIPPPPLPSLPSPPRGPLPLLSTFATSNTRALISSSPSSSSPRNLFFRPATSSPAYSLQQEQREHLQPQQPLHLSARPRTRKKKKKIPPQSLHKQVLRKQGVAVMHAYRRHVAEAEAEAEAKEVQEQVRREEYESRLRNGERGRTRKRMGIRDDEEATVVLGQVEYLDDGQECCDGDEMEAVVRTGGDGKMVADADDFDLEAAMNAADRAWAKGLGGKNCSGGDEVRNLITCVRKLEEGDVQLMEHISTTIREEKHSSLERRQPEAQGKAKLSAGSREEDDDGTSASQRHSEYVYSNSALDDDLETDDKEDHRSEIWEDDEMDVDVDKCKSEVVYSSPGPPPHRAPPLVPILRLQGRHATSHVPARTNTTYGASASGAVDKEGFCSIFDDEPAQPLPTAPEKVSPITTPTTSSSSATVEDLFRSIFEDEPTPLRQRQLPTTALMQQIAAQERMMAHERLQIMIKQKGKEAYQRHLANDEMRRRWRERERNTAAGRDENFDDADDDMDSTDEDENMDGEVDRLERRKERSNAPEPPEWDPFEMDKSGAKTSSGLGIAFGGNVRTG